MYIGHVLSSENIIISINIFCSVNVHSVETPMNYILFSFSKGQESREGFGPRFRLESSEFDVQPVMFNEVYYGWVRSIAT